MGSKRITLHVVAPSDSLNPSRIWVTMMEVLNRSNSNRGQLHSLNENREAMVLHFLKFTKNFLCYTITVAGGIDEQLAEHFAHLFIRDPVSLFQEKVGSYDDTDTDHFENIQSTNWQTMRFAIDFIMHKCNSVARLLSTCRV